MNNQIIHFFIIQLVCLVSQFVCRSNSNANEGASKTIQKYVHQESLQISSQNKPSNFQMKKSEKFTCRFTKSDVSNENSLIIIDRVKSNLSESNQESPLKENSSAQGWRLIFSQKNNDISTQDQFQLLICLPFNQTSYQSTNLDSRLIKLKEAYCHQSMKITPNSEIKHFTEAELAALSSNQVESLCSRFKSLKRKQKSLSRLKRYKNDKVLRRRKRGIFDSLMKSFTMYPGTLWCGIGHSAKNYSELGKEKEADMCCRDHDHCKVKIRRGETLQGYKNNGFYTINHCDCDKRLNDCLYNAKTTASNRIGLLFFDLIKVHCFIIHPTIKCVKGSKWLCLKYENQTSVVIKKPMTFTSAKLFKPDKL